VYEIFVLGNGVFRAYETLKTAAHECPGLMFPERIYATEVLKLFCTGLLVRNLLSSMKKIVIIIIFRIMVKMFVK
jgi:hypothetical protein